MAAMKPSLPRSWHFPGRSWLPVLTKRAAGGRSPNKSTRPAHDMPRERRKTAYSLPIYHWHTSCVICPACCPTTPFQETHMVAPHPATRFSYASSSWASETLPSRSTGRGRHLAFGTSGPSGTRPCYRPGVVNPPKSALAKAVHEKISGLFRHATHLLHHARDS